MGKRGLGLFILFTAVACGVAIILGYWLVAVISGVAALGAVANAGGMVSAPGEGDTQPDDFPAGGAL